MGWGGEGMMTFRALDNMLDATRGGVGMMTFRALDNMLDATQNHWLGWGGLGMMTFRALDNMLDAMQHHGLGWGGDDDVPCTWQHVGCYAKSLVGVGRGGDDDVPCTWQHVGCYATSWVGVGWGWWRSVHLTTFHSTSFGSKNQVVLGILIWGFLILNYNGNWHSILLPHSSGVIRMLMLKITFLLQRNTNFHKPSSFHGPKTTRPSTRRAPCS